MFDAYGISHITNVMTDILCASLVIKKVYAVLTEDNKFICLW